MTPLQEYNKVTTRCQRMRELAVELKQEADQAESELFVRLGIRYIHRGSPGSFASWRIDGVEGYFWNPREAAAAKSKAIKEGSLDEGASEQRYALELWRVANDLPPGIISSININGTVYSVRQSILSCWGTYDAEEDAGTDPGRDISDGGSEQRLQQPGEPSVG